MLRPMQRAAVVLAAVLLPLTADPARAGWGPEPVQVYATNAVCPQVAACEDGGYGAFVVWQESGGQLLASHLLGSGDRDPAWPAYVVVNGTATARTDLRAIADGSGGAWVTWLQGTTLHTQRVQGSGELSKQSLELPGILASGSRRPLIVPDGQGGLMLAGIKSTFVADAQGQLRLAFALAVWSVGPDGSPRAGWPASGRLLGPSSGNPLWVWAYGLATTPSGNLWAAWAGCLTETSAMGDTLRIRTGDIRVTRLNATGSPAPGWNLRGMALGPYPRSGVDTTLVVPWPAPWWHTPTMNLVAVSADQDEGAYVAYPFDESYDLYEDDREFRPKILRLDESGGIVAGWPVILNTNGMYTNAIRADLGDQASIRLFADGQDGCLIAYPQRFTDSPDFMDVAQVTTHGIGLWSMWNNTTSFEILPSGVGGLWWTSYYPGPAGIWTYDVHVLCEGSDAGAFYESQGSSPLVWYGDTGLATGYADGSAIFCWSQHNGRHGVYAVRVNRARQVTDAPPLVEPSARSLSLRFAPGSGIRASLLLPGAGEARLLLADVSGRAVVREAFALEAGAREWTIPGTAALAPGLYFARVMRGAETLVARVIVTR